MPPFDGAQRWRWQIAQRFQEQPSPGGGGAWSERRGEMSERTVWDGQFTLARRVPNMADGLHCAQACLIMAADLLGHERLSMAQAEQITGFRPGVETWPYAMCAWLGENGFEVRHEDAVDPVALCENAEVELRRSGLDEDTLRYVLTVSDVAQERAAVERCLASARVTFVDEAPDLSRLPQRLRDGWLPMVSLDAAVLGDRARTEFEGHMVLVTALAGADVVVQDPGPPARWDWQVPLSRVAAALHSPATTSGTITYVRRLAPAEGQDR